MACTSYSTCFNIFLINLNRILCASMFPIYKASIATTYYFVVQLSVSTKYFGSFTYKVDAPISCCET